MKRIWALIALFISSLIIHELLVTPHSHQAEPIAPIQPVSPQFVFAWDFHGVIVDRQKLAMTKQLLSMVTQAEHPWEIMKLILNYNFWQEYKKIRKQYDSADRIFAQLKKQFPILQETEPRFYELLKMYEPDQSVLNLLDALSAQGYKHFMASNISPRPLADMQQKYPAIFERFAGIYKIDCLKIDGHCYSSKPKPYIEYYKGLREYLSAQGIPETTTIIFIDDLERNIAGALNANVGIDAIRFTSASDLEKELAKRHITVSQQNVLTQPACN